MIFFATKEQAKERYDICKECDHFVNLTKQCNDCWCFLPAKVRKYTASCPKGKWGQASGDRLEQMPHTEEIPELGDYKFKDHSNGQN